jgi:hypothetical protein
LICGSTGGILERADQSGLLLRMLTTQMVEERRRSVRKVVNQPGTVMFGAVQLPCVIDDLSDGGVRLIVKGELPELFTLVFQDSAEAARQCRLVWRLDDEAGAEFITDTNDP